MTYNKGSALSLGSHPLRVIHEAVLELPSKGGGWHPRLEELSPHSQSEAWHVQGFHVQLLEALRSLVL